MFSANNELSLEQQFSLRSFANQVQEMDREQALAQLVQLYKKTLAQENLYKEVLKNQWGL